MRKLLIFSLLAVSALIVTNLIGTPVHAASTILDPFKSGTNPLGWNTPTTVADWISLIFRMLVVVGVIIAFVLMIIGGIQYLTAAGNEEGTAKAKKLLLDAVIGVIIVLAAWALGSYLIKILTGATPTVPFE